MIIEIFFGEKMIDKIFILDVNLPNQIIFGGKKLFFLRNKDKKESCVDIDLKKF